MSSSSAAASPRSSSALHLSNLIKAHNEKGEGKKLGELTIAVLEKGFSVGAHGISGAVMDPGPLKELVPDFVEKGAPLEGEVKKESIYFLTKTGKIKSPITPPPLNNHGNYVVSMSKLNQWMAELVEKNGRQPVPGVRRGRGPLRRATGSSACGPATRASTRRATRSPTTSPGTDLHARVTVFGEGSRGSLTKDLIAHFELDEGKNPPAFEVGVKEVWELPEARRRAGRGHPLHGLSAARATPSAAASSTA